MDVSSNTLIATTRELAERAEVSHKTVIETLKILKDAGIIAQRHGSLMVNSDLVHKGSHQKERFLVARFQEFAGEENGYRGDEGNEYDEVTSPDFPEEKQLTVYGN
jgi:DNA-binding GntR family transcriptional regulator